jgi:hypothetical protein
VNLGLGMHLALRCTACGEFTTEHAETCPVGHMESLLNNRRVWTCPECRGNVEVNTLDMFECRKCRGVWVTSDWLGKGEIDKDDVYLWRRTDDDAVIVHKARFRGHGKFPIDRQLRVVKKAIDKARAAFGRRSAGRRTR